MARTPKSTSKATPVKRTAAKSKPTKSANGTAPETDVTVTQLARIQPETRPQFLLPAPAITQADDTDAIIAEYEEAKREATAPYRVDIKAGKDGDDFRLTNEWSKRPADQRFLTFETYKAAIMGRKTNTTGIIVTAEDLRAIQGQTALTVKGHGKPVALTNFAYSQLAAITGLPRAFAQHCPPALASQIWDHSLSRLKGGEAVANIEAMPGEYDRLRGLTTTTYSHIWDADLVRMLEEEIFRGDSRWKVPGEYDWNTGYHNPGVELTIDNASLFAGDRDTTGFLCQDADPIEAGLTPRGYPDLFFLGLMWGNNEVGTPEPAWVDVMFLRAVCMNRSLRGVDKIASVRVRHTKNGGKTLRAGILELASQLRNHMAHLGFRDKIVAAKTVKLKIEALTFLTKQVQLSPRQAEEVIKLVKIEEGRPIETMMDASNGVTALARRVGYQDKRIDLELAASNILDIAYQMAA